MGGIGIFAVGAVLAVQPLEGSRVQVRVDTNVGYAQNLNDSASHALGGGAQLGIDIFVQRPLYDDDTPLSLQPFLQRAGKVWLIAGGNGSHWDYDGSSGPLSHFGGGGALGGFDLYVNRWVALHASFGVNAGHYESVDGPSIDSLSLPVAVGFGLRWGDLRLDLDYGVVPFRQNGTWQPIYWGDVAFSLLTVFKQRASLSFSSTLIKDGIVFGVTVAGWSSRRFSVFGGLSGGGTSPNGVDRFGGSFGVTAWASRHFGVSVSYAPMWNFGVGSIVTHTIAFSAFSRAR